MEETHKLTKEKNERDCDGDAGVIMMTASCCG